MTDTPSLPGRLLRPRRILRADLLAAPNTLFAFGDNLRRAGYGGQAREMRGEPNAVGVPTKVAPVKQEWAYFTDRDLSRAEPPIREAFLQLGRHLVDGGDVVIPADGLGTGLAELPRRAPAIHDLIERYMASLGKLARQA